MNVMVLDLDEETLFQMIEMTCYNFPLIGTQQAKILSFLILSQLHQLQIVYDTTVSFFTVIFM